MLHGEQYIEVHKEIPTHGTLEASLSVVDILDKKSGALVIINGKGFILSFFFQISKLFWYSTVEVVDESAEKVVSGQWSIFVVGAGGFGGKRSSDHIIAPVDPPKRQPDASLTYKTSIDQVQIIRE